MKCVAVMGAAAFFFILLEREWLQWVLFAGMALAAAFERRPDKPPDIEGWVKSHPFVKSWMAFCVVVIAAIALATTSSVVRFDELLGFRGMFALLIVAIAPLVSVGIWETYTEYGEQGNAT